MISIKTFDDRYLPTRQQSSLQAVGVTIRCHSQRFELISQCFIKLAFIMLNGTQSLNRSRPVSNRRIIGDFVEQTFNLVSLALTIDRESVIIKTYLPRGIHRQVHQYVAYGFKRIQIAQTEGLLCKANQFIGEFDELLSR